MTLTKAQWAAFQADIPQNSQISYETYLAGLNDELTKKEAAKAAIAAAKSAGIPTFTPDEKTKIAEQIAAIAAAKAAGIPTTTATDELTKIAGAKAALAAAATIVGTDKDTKDGVTPASTAAGTTATLPAPSADATIATPPISAPSKFGDAFDKANQIGAYAETDTGPTGPTQTGTGTVTNTATLFTQTGTAPLFTETSTATSTLPTQTSTATSTLPIQTTVTSTLPSIDLVAQQNQAAIDAANKQARQSAWDTLYNEFSKYGLGSLVDGIKGLIMDQSASPSQFAIALQNTDAYKARFSANQDRIKAGLRALNPAEYIGLEDQYQNIMRTYGLPASYYTKDATGKQSGFDKFLANDVSAAELEDRIATAQQRVINSNPEVLQALKQFYPDINNADILAYALDPQNALTAIHRKVTAAEIGGAALSQGLQAQGGTAESLAGLGVTKAQAQQGYTDIAGMLPTASKLSDIYGQGAYTQGTAEAEVFNTAGAASAAAKRKKLTGLETAAFSGSSGVGSLNRDRAVSNYMLGQPGAGSY